MVRNKKVPEIAYKGAYGVSEITLKELFKGYSEEKKNLLSIVYKGREIEVIILKITEKPDGLEHNHISVQDYFDIEIKNGSVCSFEYKKGRFKSIPYSCREFLSDKEIIDILKEEKLFDVIKGFMG